MRRAALAALLLASIGAAENRAVVPAKGAKPGGPYSPGVLTRQFLYVAGQGPRRADGSEPDSPAGKIAQTIANVRVIVEEAGLTLDHVVAATVYLPDIADVALLDSEWAKAFGASKVARSIVGVEAMPGPGPVQINAIAIRDLSKKKAAGDAVIAGDRIFIPTLPAATPEAAFARLNAALTGAGVDASYLVFVNPYLTERVAMDAMNRDYARRFEFGYSPARATIRVKALAEGGAMAYSAIAVTDLNFRRVVRPKNMPKSPTASPCVWGGDTLYCSAKSGFIPGPNGGIWASTVEDQLRQTMRNLLDGLEEAGLGFDHVVATTVYLDKVSEFQTMNGVYQRYFRAPFPARTTIAPVPGVERKAAPSGLWPKLEEVSLIAVQ